MKSKLYKVTNKLTSIGFQNGLTPKKSISGFKRYYYGISFGDEQLFIASHSNKKDLKQVDYSKVEKVSFDVAKCRAAGGGTTPMSGSPWAFTLELEITLTSGEIYSLFQYDIYETLVRLLPLLQEKNIQVEDEQDIISSIKLTKQEFNEYISLNIEHPGLNIPRK